MSEAAATLSAQTEHASKLAQFTQDKEQTYACTGHWTMRYLGELTDSIAAILQNAQKTDKNQTIHISGKSLQGFDSAGALLLCQAMNTLNAHFTTPVKLTNFSESALELFELVESKEKVIQTETDSQDNKGHKEDFLEFIGRETIAKLHQFDGLVQLVGDLTDKIFRGFGNWKKFQGAGIVSIINSAGLKALPIIALLSFLIGVVLAYQMGLQLETYGANIYIAYLSGMAIFREFGPLISAIIVAGRTSSSFTAQIGSMKINEEIDALKTMGLSPTELLALPKVLGLLFVFPLIIFWADFFSIIGSMIMSKFMLHIGYYEFLNHLQTDVGADQLRLGLYKAPAFALLIALVGCFQGFQVEHNADSIGSQTTRSVVQALFLIIIADALYSVVYSWMEL